MSRLLLTLIATAAITLTSMSVHAQKTAQERKDPRQFHYVGSVGITYGGDIVDKAKFTDGTTENIKAGDLFQLGAGVIWTPIDMPISAQFTVNYHVTDSTAKNGSLRFSRVPIEASLFYTGVNQWRFGGGIRSNHSTHFSERVDNSSAESVEFKPSLGKFLEVGYALSDRSWVSVRYVSEEHQSSSYRYGGFSTKIKNGPKVDGSHLGLFTSFHF
jgi:hypothetical protein